MNPSTDPLDQLLRRAAPVQPNELESHQVRSSMAAMLAEARQHADLDQPAATGVPAQVIALEGRRRLRGKAARALVVTSVVLVAGTGVAAAGGFLPFGTGVFGAPGMTENDTSELLNSTSPQTAEVLRGYVADLTMAPGFTAEGAIEQFTTGENTLVQDAALQGMALGWSSCSWELSWLDAHTAGDQAAQDAATAVLIDIPDSPILPRIDGGGVTEAYQAIADAAAAGDPGPIQRDVDVNCDAEYLR